MKKISKLIAALLSILMILPVFAGAKGTESADRLNELGLFLGTDRGYELERTPTRAEAGVMLVRFLGKEAYAKANAGKVKLPFDDVPEWAKPYVEYLYVNGLTVGVSENKYGTDTLCSAQMYVTFMLRALGYSDKNGDFSYSEALKFGTAKDIITKETYSEKEFLREHMVLMSERALTLPTADERYEMLAYKLSREGAIKAEQADEIYDLTEEKRLKVAFVGDSLTFGCCTTNNEEDSYPAWMKKWLGVGFKTENFGLNSSTYQQSGVTYQGSVPYERSIKFEPDVVVIMLGTNDAGISGSNTSAMLSGARSLINSYKTLKSKPKIIIVSPPDCPMIGTTIGAYTVPAVKSLANSLGLDYIDAYTGTGSPSISADTLHFTDAGYSFLAYKIFSQLADIFVEEGYMTKACAEAKKECAKADSDKELGGEVIKSQYESFDYEMLVEKYKELGKLKSGEIIYLCPDFDCSGGVYAINKTTYSQISSHSLSTTQYVGWQQIDPQSISLEYDNVYYPFTQWHELGQFDARVYVKEVENCCFLWLDNTFSFGDADGGWTTSDHYMRWGGTSSAQFTFHVCDVNKIGNRAIQYAAKDKDGTGFIYTLDASVAEQWEYISSDTINMYGVDWTRVDSFGMYYTVSTMGRTVRSCSNPAYYCTKNISTLEREYGYALYVAKKDGQYLLYCKNAANVAEIMESDRISVHWRIQDGDGITDKSSVFYHFTDPKSAPKALIKL